MFRLIFLTFFGEPRYDEHKVHVHESPHNMTVPLIILAILSTVGGWVAAPHLVGGTEYFDKFLHPVFAAYAPTRRLLEKRRSGSSVGSARQSNASELHALTGWPVTRRARGLAPRLVVLHQEPANAEKTRRKHARALYARSAQILCGRTLQRAIIQPLLWISTNVLWHVVDEGVIDGTVNGVARVARETGSELREIQSGNARSYATWVVIGAVGVTVLMLGLWGMVR